MKREKLHLSKRLLLILLTCIVTWSVYATKVIPNLPPLQSTGGTDVNLLTFTPLERDYTLEVQGTVGVEISVAGGFYTYTPTTSGTVRFSQQNKRVHVYESNVFMTTLTPTFNISFPAITDADAHNNPATYCKTQVLKQQEV